MVSYHTASGLQGHTLIFQVYFVSQCKHFPPSASYAVLKVVNKVASKSKHQCPHSHENLRKRLPCFKLVSFLFTDLFIYFDWKVRFQERETEKGLPSAVSRPKWLQ